MTKNALVPILLLLVNIPLFLFIGRKMFGSWSYFRQCFRWIYIPDLFSTLTGKFTRDMRGEHEVWKLWLLCIIIYFLELILLMELLKRSGIWDKM